jgi:hypothetical protein
MSSKSTRLNVGDDVAADDILEPKSSTVTVLGLLIATSFTFSYLGTYALSKAMVKAELLRQWPADSDPRPRWLALMFCVLLGTFGLMGAAARTLSKRHLKQIDEMAEGIGPGAADERPLRSSLTP